MYKGKNLDIDLKLERFKTEGNELIFKITTSTPAVNVGKDHYFWQFSAILVDFRHKIGISPKNQCKDNFNLHKWV
jgi:hypothetical protein